MTSHDVDLALKMERASTNGICFSLPLGVTKNDVKRLIEVELCDKLPSGAFILRYNEMELQDLHDTLIKEEEKQAKQTQEAQKKQTKETIFKALKTFASLLPKLFSICT